MATCRMEPCQRTDHRLDVTIQAQILDLLMSLKDEYGLSALFITHDFAVLAHATTHCYVLDEGRIVESGRTADVLASPRDERTRRLVGAARELTLHAGDAGDKEQSS